MAGPFGLGDGAGVVGEVDVEVEVEVELELDECDELLELELLELELLEGVVLDEALLDEALLELLLSGTQFSVSLVITPETGGRLRFAIGVPGATLGTVNV